MEIDAHPLDRHEVEQIAYQAIAHQFRLPALFSVVLMVVGFVLGHYVASSHIREATAHLEERIARLNEAVEKTQALAAEVSRNAATVASCETPAENPFLDRPVAAASHFRLSGLETVFDGREIQHRNSFEECSSPPSTVHQVESLRAEVAAEKNACLAELAPYLDRQRPVPAATVSGVLNALYDEQDRRLQAVCDSPPSSFGAPHDSAEIPSAFRPDEDRTTDSKFPPAEAPLETAPAPMQTGASAQQAPRFFPRPRTATTIYFSGASRKTATSSPE